MRVPEEAELESFLQKAQRRSYGLQKLRLRSQAMAYAGLLSSGVVFLGLLLGGEPVVLSLVVGGVYFGFALGYLIQKNSPSLFEVAQDLDTRLELKDQLSRALCFSDPKVLSEAVALSRSIKLAKAFPDEELVSPKGTSGGSAALLLASVALLLFHFPETTADITAQTPNKQKQPNGNALTWQAQAAKEKTLARSPSAKLITRGERADLAVPSAMTPMEMYFTALADVSAMQAGAPGFLVTPEEISPTPPKPPPIEPPIDCNNPGENPAGEENGSQNHDEKSKRGGDTVKPAPKLNQRELPITKDENGSTVQESSKGQLAVAKGLINNEAAKEAMGENHFDPLRVLEESLLNEEISLERREYIKQYFLLIRGE